MVVHYKMLTAQTGQALLRPVIRGVIETSNGFNAETGATVDIVYGQIL